MSNFSVRLEGNRGGRGAIHSAVNIGTHALDSKSTHSHSYAHSQNVPVKHSHNSGSSFHRKSQSLDAATISLQIASNIATKFNKSQPQNAPKER